MLTIPFLHFSRHRQMYEARVKTIIEILSVSNFYERSPTLTNCLVNMYLKKK